MKLIWAGVLVLLATAVYADHKDHKNANRCGCDDCSTCDALVKKLSHSPKLSKPSPRSSHPAPPHPRTVPKSHNFVRHARKLPQLHRPIAKILHQKPSPRQFVQLKSKGPFRKIPVRKYPRRLPHLKARQTPGIPVPLPAFQNRPIQPIPSLRPVQVVPVQRNPRFRRLVTNLRQSASKVRQGIERGNSNLRQSFRSLQSRNPLPFRRPLPNPGNQNRRKIQLPSIVYKRAEDMPGYEKFTLAEVIYPEEESKIGKRVDNEEDIKLVDTPLDIDPRIKNKDIEANPFVKTEVKKKDN